MENNDSNLKPQSTGGLKLMTVFIIVLTAHVMVIGGYSIYKLMNGGGSELTDNPAPKDAKVAPDGSVVMDSQLPDGSQPDKTAAANNATPAPSANAAPAPAVEPASPAETTGAPAPAPVADEAASTPTGPVITPLQATAPEITETEPTTAPPLEPETTVAPMVSASVYVVKMHDTLPKIAHRHHTTVAKLESANGLHGDLLHVGQRLVIPGKTVVAAVPAADATGSTILSGTPVTAPDETAVAPAQAPSIASHHAHTYTVVKGDTLTRIAHKFRTTAKALMAANNITDPTKLGIGRKLTIPSHQAQTTTTVTPVTAPAPVQNTVQDAVPPAPAKTTAQLANFVQ